MPDPLAESIATDVMRLCAPENRDLGTGGNAAATELALWRFGQAGLETGSHDFEVPAWRSGVARVNASGLELEMHPGPFTIPIESDAPLAIVRSADEIATVAPDSVLLLCGDIAATQFTPRNYPFYSNPEHAAILDALEAATPVAIIAATTKSAMTGAMSPFPLIEEVGFSVPTAYLRAEEGAQLATHEGEVVSVRIQSEVLDSNGIQPVARRAGRGPGRIVVSAHIDSKPETRGAIDNAAGVAVMFAVAELLADADLEHTVEFVPFNGEDHVLAPGELAWLAANPDLTDVVLAINIDAPGLPGAPSAYSLYGVGDEVAAAVARLAAENPSVAEGPQWPASDHMIFAMRGIPAIAVTSTDFATASGEYSHTPADVPEILDHDLLAGTARFVADLIAAL